MFSVIYWNWQWATLFCDYRKNSRIWNTSNNCHNCSKNRKVWCNIALMHPKDADGTTNSVDPDQTASEESVWSWSPLFAETYLSQYIEFVRYFCYVSYTVCWLILFSELYFQYGYFSEVKLDCLVTALKSLLYMVYCRVAALDSCWVTELSA